LVSVPITFLNVLNEIAALILVSGAEFLSAFQKSQLDALALLFIRLHSDGVQIVAIFWGLWLFPFGILVIRSGFIPRILGILLFIAGSGYVASSFTTLVLPQYRNFVDQVRWFLGFWKCQLCCGSSSRDCGHLGKLSPRELAADHGLVCCTTRLILSFACAYQTTNRPRRKPSG